MIYPSVVVHIVYAHQEPKENVLPEEIFLEATAFVPSTVGLIIASKVIKDLTSK